MLYLTRIAVFWKRAMGGTFNKAANGDNKKWKTVKAMRCKSQNECIGKLAFAILVRQKIGKKHIRAYFLQELPSWWMSAADNVLSLSI